MGGGRGLRGRVGVGVSGNVQKCPGGRGGNQSSESGTGLAHFSVAWSVGSRASGKDKERKNARWL